MRMKQVPGARLSAALGDCIGRDRIADLADVGFVPPDGLRGADPAIDDTREDTFDGAAASVLSGAASLAARLLDMNLRVGSPLDDLLYGDGAVSAPPGGSAELDGDGQILRGGRGNDLLYGDGVVSAPFGTAELTGGDDIVFGGAGDDVVWGDGDAGIGRTRSTLVGGDDMLGGGGGKDVVYGDGRAENVFGGSDLIRGGAGDDILWGDGGGFPVLTGANDVVSGGGGQDVIYGDGEAGVIYIGPALLTGGDDTLSGGAGADTIYGDGTATGAGYSATLIGGDDLVRGGSGADVLYGDGTVSGSAGATLTGGADLLRAGKGNDVIWGDGTAAVTAVPGVDAVLDGGADTFVFRATDGLDAVMDFRIADGDTMRLVGTALAWGDLDSNDSGVLDNGDAFVASDGMDTMIDLGAAAGASAAGLNVVTLISCTGLAEADLLFA